ncbi:MAG: hypothetical protein COV59_04325 [Candidatus Magasanikbacteria bacterium CG11_big_fil_rev_8_21_14_0_20_39_34]|uniref:Membrane insertase YidC/Oxa/ALB C-terminal domain-containing protein n=1 Tax=Candidatus Magasanikbacteria bacterium CG11_big_fil_rev_8_21_14_0_20_39_34 TaxID=1974653 RepID=A0A2H0N4P3_9BACT|nr:MAG: hypothetical protein COV59_04325 [Candidatus Magasanikbacteria bacterium CG11_big_fil_rev_8_21_14_0_20_39_34]
MFSSIWNDFLFRPLFNFLFYAYNNWTEQNLGWAVIYVTILLRMFLLPLTLIMERNKISNIELSDEVKRLEKDYAKDPVQKKEEIRKVLKKRKVSPWAKAMSLGIQGLFLVLLYQVFTHGIVGKNVVNLLYDSVDFPGAINTTFYGFELGERNTLFWPGLITLFLLVEIYFEFRGRKNNLYKSDLMFFFLFPLSVFLALWWLPMVKSLFILASMIFSLVIGWVSLLLFRGPKKKKA